MNFKNLILISGLILVVSVIAYYFLGGFNEVTYSIYPANSYKIIGKESREKPKTAVELQEAESQNASDMACSLDNPDECEACGS